MPGAMIVDQPFSRDGKSKYDTCVINNNNIYNLCIYMLHIIHIYTTAHRTTATYHGRPDAAGPRPREPAPYVLSPHVARPANALQAELRLSTGK